MAVTGLEPFTKLARDLASGRYAQGVNYASAREIKQIGLKETAKVIGSDLIMRNYPRRGRPRKANIGYDAKGSQMSFRFRPPGMFGIIEGGTSHSRPLGRPIPATIRQSRPVWLKNHAKQIRERI
jgi:hypothetical protein